MGSGARAVRRRPRERGASSPLQRRGEELSSFMSSMRSDADQTDVATVGEARVDLELPAERSNEASQGGNHVVFALLDP